MAEEPRQPGEKLLSTDDDPAQMQLEFPDETIDVIPPGDFIMPHPYQPNNLRKADAILSSVVAGIIEWVADHIFEASARGLKRILPKEQVNIEEVQGVIRRAILKTISGMREARLIESVPPDQLPELIPGNAQKSAELGNIIRDFIDSPVANKLSFADEIMTVVRSHAFAAGVQPENLIKYFQNDWILNLLMKELLHSDETAFRNTTAWSQITSAMKSIARKLRTRAERKSRKEVQKGSNVGIEVNDTAEMKLEKIFAPRNAGVATDEKLRAHIAYFGVHYNPRDRKKTVSNFIKNLQAKYPDDDVLGWLKKNKKTLREIFVGKEAIRLAVGGDESTIFTHLADAINDAYLQCAIEDPRKYMDMEVPNFIGSYNNRTAQMDKMLATAGRVGEPAVIIDLPELLFFFHKKVEKISRASDKHSLVSLKGYLADACVAYIMAKYPNARTAFVREDDHPVQSLETFGSTSELIQAVKDMVLEKCQIISSHLDVRNLLEDPDSTPPEIQGHYQKWYPKRGTFKQGSYQRFLDTIFRHVVREELESDPIPAVNDDPGASLETRVTDTLEVRPEDSEKVYDRVERVFKKVDAYLHSISKDLGIPEINCGEIRDCKNYAELVKIACKHENPKIRFAARRKLELAGLAYSLMGTPRYVYQDYESRAIKAFMQTAPGGLKINRKKEKERVEFIDPPDGKVSIVKQGRGSRDGIKKAELIHANFADTPCYVVPTNDLNEKKSSDEYDYIRQKSFNSMMTNLLGAEGKRASDLTDLQAMTIVVKNLEDLKKIQRHVEANLMSFGRMIKTENRYDEGIRSGTFYVGENDSKSDEYKTLRYVIDIPVPEENPPRPGKKSKTYLATLELRVLLLEDFCKERSENNDGSHKKYERKRLRKILKRVAPIEHHPEFYKTTKPHLADVNQNTEIVPKDEEDYAMAA